MLHGVDGCRAGWVVATSDGWPDFSLQVIERAAAIAQLGGVVAIDVPIGLPECGARDCDQAARRVLGKRQGSRVFPTPCRATLAGTSYAECCVLSLAASGKKISRQAHGILRKIRDIDGLMTPLLQQRVREVHPEVSFCTVNEQPLVHNKKTHSGQQERRHILARYGLSCDWERERVRLGRRRVSMDDLLDATVCLLTAKRVQNGIAQRLGAPTFDAKGLRMEIWT